MVAHIALSDAQAWLEGTKCNLTDLDVTLEKFVSTEVLGRLSDTFNDPTFGVPTWLDANTTPQLVKDAIAMTYAGWFYDRQYSEVLASEGNSYGLILRNNANMLIEGMISGSIVVVDILPNIPSTLPVFYPTDVSSTADAVANNTDPDDLSFGGNVFGVAKVF